MKKLAKFALPVLMLGIMMVPMVSVLAQTPPPKAPTEWETNYGLDLIKDEVNVPQPTNPETALPEAVVAVINLVLGFLALLAIVIILIGGFEWMTAGGNDTKVETAQKRLKYGLTGLVIIFLAYAIVTFVLSKLGGLLT